MVYKLNFDQNSDVLRISILEDEAVVIRECVREISTRLDDIPEAKCLDELQALAEIVREQLPRLNDILAGLADHCGPKVTIIETQKYWSYEYPTPLRHLTPADLNLFAPDLVRGLILGLANLYGYGWKNLQHGVVHNNIIPIREHETTYGHNASSTEELALHTEVASYNLGEHLDVSPDYLSMHFYSKEPIVPTIVSIPDWKGFPESDFELLRRHWFVNKTSPAQGGERNNVNQPISVVYGSEDDPWLRISTSEIRESAYSAEQRKALQSLVRHLNNRTFEIPLSTGSIVLVDNRRALHGRAAHASRLRPRYDGTDRWQRRLMASSSAQRIRAFEAAPRVVDVAYFLQHVAGNTVTSDQRAACAQ